MGNQNLHNISWTTDNLLHPRKISWRFYIN